MLTKVSVQHGSDISGVDLVMYSGAYRNSFEVYLSGTTSDQNQQ